MVRNLTAMTHAKAVEIANKKLNSRREMFVKALSYQQINDDTWIVSLDAKMRWIDEGMKPHDMLDFLLKSPKAKRAKDGSVFLTIPFDHSPGKGASATPAQQDLTATIKKEMKNKGIPFGKIERNADGSAKLGKLHSFDILDKPLKTGEGPGQGWGPIGDVKQGPNERQKVGGGPSGGGTPFLKGVNVYQNKMGDGSVKRSIMTFRIASSKHRGTGMWQHPGLEPTNIMEETAEWCRQEIEKLTPMIVGKILMNLT